MSNQKNLILNLKNPFKSQLWKARVQRWDAKWDEISSKSAADKTFGVPFNKINWGKKHPIKQNLLESIKNSKNIEQ
jgi:hypothetical protein